MAFFFKQKIGYYDGENKTSFFTTQYNSIVFDSTEEKNTLKSQQLNLTGGTAYLLHLQFTSNQSLNNQLSVILQQNSNISEYLQTIYNEKIPSAINNNILDIVFITQEFDEANYYLLIENKQTINITTCVLSQIKTYPLDTSENKIIHLGIQANPFTYIILDGQILQVGKNGFYEIDGVEIQKFSIAPISPGVFIIDYKYAIEDESQSNQIEENTSQSENSEEAQNEETPI